MNSSAFLHEKGSHDSGPMKLDFIVYLVASCTNVNKIGFTPNWLSTYDFASFLALPRG